MHLLKVLPVIFPALLATLVSGQEREPNNATNHLLATPDESQRGPYYQATDVQPSINQHPDDPTNGSLDNLSFKFMNGPRERLEAVQNVVVDSQEVQSSSEEFHQTVMLQCHYKGQQYKHGQSVPIEDQPCLNCTCHRAILQCYLRVCPPIHTTNAERRHIDNSGLDTTKSRPRCRLQKEPNQCCPTLKCELVDSMVSNRSAIFDQEPQGSSTTTTTVQPHPVNLDTDTVSAARETDEKKAISKQIMQSIHNRSVEQDTQLQTSQPNDLMESSTSSAPKLTVINGATGQRDSILLISSNPGGPTTERPVSELSKGDFSNALIEALLETVYSSGAQLSGLNLEGSCMINGSLYIEGSAVIPEGNAFCQYCYCIRQKIMCIRPKCQLIISGCTPKYNNEYACCPTSYACSQSSLSNSLVTRTPLTHRSGSPMEQIADANQTQALSARLWSAIESLSKHLGRPTRHNLDSQDAVESPVHTTTTTTSQANSSTTPVVETSTATITENPTSITTVDSSQPGNSNAEPTDTSTEFGARINPLLLQPAEPVELSERSRQPETFEPTSTTTTTEEPSTTTSTEQPPSSVSDFLEPMNRLGPLVVSPSAPSSCIENGRHYSIGEQIPTRESCKHCYCGLDGLKECKIVECSLKILHNCRPITPEGHCCPVRYECPPGSGLGSTGSRYRSEPLCTGSINDGPECASFGAPKTEELQIELNRTSVPESLNEELNKFIMRINPASVEPSTSHPQSNTELPPLMSTIPFETGLKSQEAAINEQNSQIVFQDYPATTQVATEQLFTGTGLPEGLQTAEISSATPASELTVSTSTSGFENPEAVSAAVTLSGGVGSQRDSRSTDTKFQVLNELLEEQKRQLTENLPHTNSEEYSVDTLAQPAALDETGQQRAMNHSHMVVFDDEQLLPHNLTNNPTRSGQPPASEFITGNLIEPAAVTRTEANGLDTSTSPLDYTSTQVNTEPTTTGTPIGLEADRSPETKGWLRSLHGVVSSFGRRLVGSTPVSNHDGSPHVSGNELLGAASGSQSSRLTGETARSRSPSIFNQILKSVIGDDQDALVMRPLISGRELSHRSDHMDLTAASSAIEMSAALPSTPAEFASAGNGGAGETLLGSDSTPQIQIHRMLNNNKPANRPQPTHISLTCYEPLTNRTYVANEIIPKDDPCKTCTCVLGEELCQNLVCPEKPGPNCKAEERPGECCPNYMCGNEVLNSIPMPRTNLIKDPLPATDPKPQLTASMNPLQIEPSNHPMRRMPLVPLNNNIPYRLAVPNQQVNNLNDQIKPNLSPQQLRMVNNLANFLPPHLRFRPNQIPNNNMNQNPQNSLLYSDRNNILFNNQRLPTLPEYNANNLAGFNSQRLNKPLPSDLFSNGFPHARSPIFADQTNNRGPTNIRLPVLMHPHQYQKSNVAMNNGIHQMLPPPSPTLNQAPQQRTNLIVPATVLITTSPPQLVALSLPQQVSLESNSQQQDFRKKPFELTNELQDSINKERVIFPNQLQPDFNSGFKPINSPPARPSPERTQPPRQPSAPTIVFEEVPSSTTEQTWSSEHLSTIPDIATTITTSTTTTTTNIPTSTRDSTEFDSKRDESGESTDSERDNSTPSSSFSSDDNLLSIFKVSECNIYGHIYKVGEVVDRLSNSCKRCTCSSNGVDCRSLCA